MRKPNYRKELEALDKESQPNIHRDTARLRKVVAISDALAKYRITAELASKQTDKEWAMVAEIAGVKPPGKVTREQVIERLRAMEDPLPVEKEGEDPFEKVCGPVSTCTKLCNEHQDEHSEECIKGVRHGELNIPASRRWPAESE